MHSTGLSLKYYSNTVISIGRLATDLHKIAAQRHVAVHWKQTVHINKNQSTLPNIVVVIGESTSRNHMGLYGYHVPDTPRMQQRADAGELHIFRDVISPQSETLLSLTRALTFYHNGASGNWTDYTDLIDIVRQAGYHTVWISNQEPTGVYGESPLMSYADACDEKDFTRLKDHSLNKTPDEALLPLLDDALQRQTEKNFYVIHLMGTHTQYSDRYPKEFARFTAVDENQTRPEWQTIRAEYDNAILYNDYILDEIIQRFENKSTLLIYFSDHGEEVCENRNFFGHFHDGTLYQIEIPMLAWTSAKFQQQYPGDSQRIQAAVNQPFMTDDLIHAILDILLIDADGYEENKSLFSPAFIPKQRIYNGIDYDKNRPAP